MFQQKQVQENTKQETENIWSVTNFKKIMGDSKGEMDLKTLLRTMKPKLHDKDLFVFLTIKTGLIPEEIENYSVFSMKEVEGRTFVVPKNIAENHGLEFEYPCRMITLQIHSSLSAVG